MCRRLPFSISSTVLDWPAQAWVCWALRHAAAGHPFFKSTEHRLVRRGQIRLAAVASRFLCCWPKRKDQVNEHWEMVRENTKGWPDKDVILLQGSSAAKTLGLKTEIDQPFQRWEESPNIHQIYVYDYMYIGIYIYIVRQFTTKSLYIIVVPFESSLIVWSKIGWACWLVSWNGAILQVASNAWLCPFRTREKNTELLFKYTFGYRCHVTRHRHELYNLSLYWVGLFVYPNKLWCGSKPAFGMFLGPMDSDSL